MRRRIPVHRTSKTLAATSTIAALVLFEPPANAEQIYQAVDEEGRVIYTDRKPADATQVETVTVTPATRPDSEIEESRERADRLVEEAALRQAERDAERAAREADIAAAQQRVQAAESALNAAREVGEGDRRGTAGGGSRLTPEYHARVEAAEAELAAAREALRAARSGR
jgi:hypothetical protein